MKIADTDFAAVDPQLPESAGITSAPEGNAHQAVVIVNREGGCGAFGMAVSGSLPTFSLDRRNGFGLFDKGAAYDEAACQAGGDTLEGSLIPGLTVGRDR